MHFKEKLFIISWQLKTIYRYYDFIKNLIYSHTRNLGPLQIVNTI
jgi:hypothetical protein